MRAPERRCEYSLRFSSSAPVPLVRTGAGAVCAGRFRRDVTACLPLLEADGDVLISCTGRYAFSVALLAAWLAGKSVVLPPNHLRETLRDVRERFDIAREFDMQWAEAMSATPFQARHADWNVQLQPKADAVKMFTSGSSGRPKVIVKSLANLLDEAAVLGSRFDWPEGVVVGSVPPHHLYGLTFTVLLPWVTGRPWVDDVPLYPADIRGLLQATGSRILISIPTLYRALLHDNADMSGIFCVSAAAKLPRDHAIRWQQQYGLDILEIYGSTETGVIGFRQQAAGETWQALPGVELSVCEGLLKVRSPFGSDDWREGYQTADRARLLDGGGFELFGRVDSIVKIGGKRISLDKIEHSLLACPGVAEVAVISVSESGRVRDEAIWAAVVARDNCRLTPRELQAGLRETLESVEVPRRIVIVECLPRTASGKLPRAALEALFGIGPAVACSPSKI